LLEHLYQDGKHQQTSNHGRPHSARKQAGKLASQAKRLIEVNSPASALIFLSPASLSFVFIVKMSIASNGRRGTIAAMMVLVQKWAPLLQ